MYRYFMTGMFSGADGNQYEITIPSPFVHITRKRALEDGHLAFRFGYNFDLHEWVILVFAKESIRWNKESGDFEVFVNGNTGHILTWDSFAKSGGYIRLVKPEAIARGFIDLDDYLDTDKNFSEILDGLDINKLQYIDNQCYSIDRINKNEV